MAREAWFGPKWVWGRRFALAALGGLALAGVGYALDLHVLAAFGLVALVPLVFWLAFLPVLHWKDRYVGGHDQLWGAFLVFETSSWSKLVYWFRHVLPDKRRDGRYRDIP